MNKNVKDKWVAALRSGEYKQTVYQLKKDLPSVGCRWCALGVLCQLAVDAGVTDDDVFNGTGLSEDVRTWAGLTEEAAIPDPIEYKQSCLGSIMGANDTLRMNFSQIADIIEEQF